MRLRRLSRVFRIALVWMMVAFLTIDTASACWWLRSCRRAQRCCPTIYCGDRGATSDYGMADEPTPAPGDDSGWRPLAGSRDTETDTDSGSTVPAQFVPDDNGPNEIAGENDDREDPLTDLFADDGEEAVEQLPVDETPVELPESDEDLAGDEMEDDPLDALEPDDQGLEPSEEPGGFAEGVADEEEDLFGEGSEDAGELVEDEGADLGDFAAPAEDPADEDFDEDFFDEPADDLGEEPADEVEDLFGPLGDDTAQPTEEPADEVEDLFGPADEPGDEVEDFFGPQEPAEEPADEVEDLFGPVEDAAPSDEPADEVEDLFGFEEETPAEEPADDVEDLFGPAEEPADEPADEVENLFGPIEDAAPADEPADEVEDLFGPIEETPAEEGSNEIDDLFGPIESEEEPVDPFGARGAETEGLAMRTWVDNTGLYRTNGRLVVIGHDFVRLMKDNGHTTTVPLRRLCDGDRALVEQLIAAYGVGEVDRLASR